LRPKSVSNQQKVPLTVAAAPADPPAAELPLAAVTMPTEAVPTSADAAAQGPKWSTVRRRQRRQRARHCQDTMSDEVSLSVSTAPADPPSAELPLAAVRMPTEAVSISADAAAQDQKRAHSRTR